jgi:hypothetical protein
MAKHSKRCASRGSRAEVMHGNKDCTTGGLTKKDLMYNKHGRIVSRKKHGLAKKQKHLEAAGYSAKKGKFGYIRIPKTMKTRKAKHGKKHAKKHTRKGRKERK